MLAVETASRLHHPRAPGTFEESGLGLDLIVQLSLKTLHFAGELDRERAGAASWPAFSGRRTRRSTC